jgi:hypothetical protein
MKINKKILVLLALIIVTVLGLKIAIYDNINFLFATAAGLNRPSVLYSLIQNRIYKLVAEKGKGASIYNSFKSGKNNHLEQDYIKVLGIIGGYLSIDDLTEVYYKQKDNEKSIILTWYVISSMGMTGDVGYVPLLESLLSNYDDKKMQVSRYLIARSLYMITGKRINYINSTGEKVELAITDELKSIRKLIQHSKGKKRSYKEMLALERFYLPPRSN